MSGLTHPAQEKYAQALCGASFCRYTLEIGVIPRLMTFPKTRNWRFNARYGALALLAMSLSACSLEERKTARVVIDLSELRADRAASSRWAASSLNATAMSTPAQPTWGSGGRALTSYSDLDCVMLNVMGEGIPSARPDMPATRPENWDQNKICSYVYPGTYSIPTSINQTTIELSVSVQKGPARLVQLIGLKKPAALRCEDITLPLMMSDGVVTERHELGIAKVDLMSDTTVEIQGNIASAKLIAGCGGQQNGGGPPSVVFGNFGFSIPVSSCVSTNALVYLYQGVSGSFQGRNARKMSNAVLSCESRQEQDDQGNSVTRDFIFVPGVPYTQPYNSALLPNGSEGGIQDSDQLRLEVRWTDTGGTELDVNTRLRKEARYDGKAPSTQDGIPSLEFDPNFRVFTSIFPNLSEDGFASIRQGLCNGTYVTDEVPVKQFSSGFPVSLTVSNNVTLVPGSYNLVVRDSVGNQYCPGVYYYIY